MSLKGILLDIGVAILAATLLYMMYGKIDDETTTPRQVTRTEKTEDYNMGLVRKVKSLMRAEGYQLDERPFALNIVGIRSLTKRSNSFDDELFALYKDHLNQWFIHVFKATTDPGTYWLNNPMKSAGTAILKAGQYRYKKGYHKNAYRALIQADVVTVIRDYDRDSKLDLRNGVEETGWFGINIHKAGVNGVATEINSWSAGCQVLADARDFDVLMRLVDQHIAHHGNRLTYTLLDFKAKKKRLLRRILAGFTLTTIGGLGFLAYEQYR